MNPDQQVQATSPAPARPSSAKGRWLTGFKILFAVLLLGYVGTRIPWRDRLIWSGGEEELSASGHIDGDWKADTIGFEPAQAALKGWPEELRAALADGAPLVRGDGLDWQPGLPRVFGEVRASGLVLAIVLLAVGVFITATRWWRLLAAAGVRARWYDAFRLTSLGLFFNIVVPGLTGGDLIKAVLVARENPESRAAAAVSVVVDRILGLFTLLAMGATVILVVGGDYAELRKPVLGVMVGGVLGAVVYTSRAFRRLIRFDAVMARLPMGGTIAKIDRAALIYSSHPGTLALSFGLSVANHLTVVAAVFALGRAFGDTLLAYFDYVALVSVGNTASSLPIAPGGWGVGEAIYGYLFDRLGAGATLGVAVSVSYRLCMMLIGLVGGVFLLLPGAREEIARIEELDPAAA